VAFVRRSAYRNAIHGFTRPTRGVGVCWWRVREKKRERERERESVGERTSVSDPKMRVQPHVFRSMKNDRGWCASGWVGTVTAGYYIHTMARPPHGTTKVERRESESG